MRSVVLQDFKSHLAKNATLLVLKYTLPSIISNVLITIVMIFFIIFQNRKTKNSKSGRFVLFDSMEKNILL